MNKFVEAAKNFRPETRTENGAKTYTTSGRSIVDLYFQIGAMRGQDLTRLHTMFADAFAEDPYIATRVLLWARDVRGGAGERQIFRELLRWLESNNPDVLELVLPKVPEVGRWDDLVGKKNEHQFRTEKFRTMAFDIVEGSLRAKNGLCAKWMPRKGLVAEALRKHFKLTPKQYRKVLVTLTEVVETAMCAKDWSAIDYEKVPSLAQARYAKAFKKNDEARYTEFASKAKEYAEHVAKVERGEVAQSAAAPEKVKINVGAVYPYDVLKPVVSTQSYRSYGRAPQAFSADTVRAQWLSLPNYVGGRNILAMADISSSMEQSVAGNENLQVIDVAVSTALYMASKNTGAYHNLLLTFTSNPTLRYLKGEDVVDHVRQLYVGREHGSTNLEAAFRLVLQHAKDNNVPASDMPETILIISDMEFNPFSAGQSAMQNIASQYNAAGYRIPQLAWWNVASRNSNVPVAHDARGNALVSGFSPSVVKSVLGGGDLTPMSIVLKAISDPRYDLGIEKKAA